MKRWLQACGALGRLALACIGLGILAAAVWLVYPTAPDPEAGIPEIQDMPTPDRKAALAVHQVDRSPVPHLARVQRVGPPPEASDEQPLPKPRLAPGGTTETVIGAGTETRYRPRMNAVRELGRHLDSGQIGALLTFLDAPSDPAGILTQRQFDAVRNDVLLILFAQENFPERELAALLLETVSDPDPDDPIWHDYRIQHIPAYYARRWPDSVDEFSEPDAERLTFARVLFTLADEGSKPSAGTALLSIERLTETHAEFTHHALADAAWRVASDPSAHVAARATAVQLAARHGHVGALALARRLAMDAAAPTVLRMSSVAAIGQAGGEKDIALLESLQTGSDRVLRMPADSALTLVQARL